MRALKVLCGAAALAALLAPRADADEWNKRTYLTFSGPVQIPGATLPAGTYTFEIANPDTTRHVIRVSEKDSNKPIGLFMTIPVDRLEPPSDNLIMFSERPAGSPQAIQVWFYPGDRIGEEFVYPKSQAMQIAKANKKSVLATEEDKTASRSESDRVAAMKGAKISRIDERGDMKSEDSRASTTTAQSTTRPPAARTAPRSTTTARSATVGTAGAQDNAAPKARRRQLPRTGSNLVALELMSVLALAGGLAARKLRQMARHVE